MAVDIFFRGALHTLMITA